MNDYVLSFPYHFNEQIMCDRKLNSSCLGVGEGLRRVGWEGIKKEHEKTLGNAGYMHHFNSGGRLWVCSYAKS